MVLQLLQSISLNLCQQIQILSIIGLHSEQHHSIQQYLGDEVDEEQQFLSMLLKEYLHPQLQDEFSIIFKSN